jgi:hypothetical protein
MTSEISFYPGGNIAPSLKTLNIFASETAVLLDRGFGFLALLKA